jgi:hypothetical protein
MEVAVRRKEGGVSEMKISTTNRRQFRPSQLGLMGVGLMMLALALPASASLGGDLGSVQADQAQMKASIKITQSDAYAVHEMKTETGTVVREYVASDGHVFGVAWHGPFMPSMQQILGTYFPQYITALKAAKAGQHGRRPLNIQEPGLVVQSGGHMRAYSGRVYVPEMMPQSVNADLIK